MSMRIVAAKSGLMTITQGEYAITDDPTCILSTILGSCVSTCLWDETRGIGGMNHVLVARSGTGTGNADAAGVNAMELLINGLVRKGADRSRLKAKVFGGAKMISRLSDVGQLNGVFTLEFLQREGIPCVSHSLGGTSARQVRFHPSDGRAMMKMVVAAPEESLVPEPAAPAPGNDVELF